MIDFISHKLAGLVAVTVYMSATSWVSCAQSEATTAEGVKVDQVPGITMTIGGIHTKAIIPFLIENSTSPQLLYVPVPKLELADSSDNKTRVNISFPRPTEAEEQKVDLVFRDYFDIDPKKTISIGPVPIKAIKIIAEYGSGESKKSKQEIILPADDGQFSHLNKDIHFPSQIDGNDISNFSVEIQCNYHEYKIEGRRMSITKQNVNSKMEELCGKGSDHATNRHGLRKLAASLQMNIQKLRFGSEDQKPDDDYIERLLRIANFEKYEKSIDSATLFDKDLNAIEPSKVLKITTKIDQSDKLEQEYKRASRVASELRDVKDSSGFAKKMKELKASGGWDQQAGGSLSNLFQGNVKLKLDVNYESDEESEAAWKYFQENVRNSLTEENLEARKLKESKGTWEGFEEFENWKAKDLEVYHLSDDKFFNAIKSVDASIRDRLDKIEVLTFSYPARILHDSFDVYRFMYENEIGKFSLNEQGKLEYRESFDTNRYKAIGAMSNEDKTDAAAISGNQFWQKSKGGAHHAELTETVTSDKDLGKAAFRADVYSNVSSWNGRVHISIWPLNGVTPLAEWDATVEGIQQAKMDLPAGHRGFLIKIELRNYSGHVSGSPVAAVKGFTIVEQ